MAQIEVKIERLLQWLQGEKAPPTILHVHVTNQCNLDCLICPRFPEIYDYSRELPDEKWLDIFEQSKQLGAVRWELIGGGEPLMRASLIKKLIVRIKHAGMEGFLITNGTLLSKDISALLVDQAWDNITISIDGATPYIHDVLKHHNGAFRDTVANVKQLVSIRNTSRCNVPHIRMNTVFTRVNYPYLLDIFKMAVEIGFEECSFQPVEIHHDQGASLIVPAEGKDVVREQMELIVREAERFHIKTNAHQFLERQFFVESPENKQEALSSQSATVESDIVRFPCFEPWYLMVIYSEGQVLPCRAYKGQMQRVTENTLEQIWYGDVFEEVRHHLVEGKLLSFCQSCAVGQIIEDLRVRQMLQAFKNGRNS